MFIGLLSCGKKDTDVSEDEKTGYAIKTEKPIRVVNQDKIKAVGRLSYRDEYKLSFKTSGIIQTVNVKNGQKVKRGQVLAALKLDEIKARTTQAEASLNKAKRDMERVKGLYKDSVATLEQYQNARTQLNMAQMDYEAASFNLQYSLITAPKSGVVQKVMFKENEAVQAGATIVVFGATQSTKVLTTNVSDVDAMKIHIGDTAELKFDPLPAKIFEGYVEEIAGMADPATGTYEASIRVADRQNVLMPGLIGNAEIFSSERESLYQVSLAALLYADKDAGTIYLEKDGKALLTNIVTVGILNDKLLVSEGLNENDRVIVEGQHRFTKDTVVLN